MTISDLDFLETTAQKTAEWVRGIKEELGWDNNRQAYHALRAVIHTLRDRLPVNEAVDLGAQLPLIIRGSYYEGWTPNDKPEKIRHIEEFTQSILEKMEWDTTGMDGEEIARAVFAVMADHVSEGEVEDVKSNLPKEIRELWP